MVKRYTAIRYNSTCNWEAEIPFENMYNFSDNGDGTATVTCVPTNGKKAKFTISGEFDTTNKITTWTLKWMLPWSGTQNTTGDQGDYEIMTVVLEQESDSCNIRQCPLSLSTSLTIEGNADYTNAEGYFNQSYWTIEKFCELWAPYNAGAIFAPGSHVWSYYSVNGDGSCNEDGRCCTPDGSCYDTDRETCARIGGSFEPGETCCTQTIFGTDCTNPCSPPETNGCCFPDGTCQDMTAQECLELNGTPQNQKCSFVTCTGVGKCCLPGGDCVLTTAADCSARSGTYDGDGTNCSDGCAGDPTGACCLENGSCVETTSASCSAQGGNYQGDATTCDSVSCGDCNKCEDGATAPPSVTLIISGGTTNPGFDCDCPDVNGSFTLTPTDEQPCLYTYTQTCTPGFDIVYSAELFGIVSESQPKPGWQISVRYNGDLITDYGFSAFVDCGGGGDDFFQSGKNGGLCEGSRLSFLLIV